MISFSSGAFPGYDAFGLIPKFTMDFFIPYQGYWKNTADPDRTPQNVTALLKPDTVYENIAKTIPDAVNYVKNRFGDPFVVANNHYARGAFWLTWDIELAWGESAILDSASWGKLGKYLGDGTTAGKYDEIKTGLTPERNKVPFSAITTWYLPGLDHQAHIRGVESYRSYFTNYTDSYVKKLTDRLIDLDEFDNKIFIIVADHGHTAMPTELTYENIVEWIDIDGNVQSTTLYPQADMSCNLRLTGFNKKEVQLPEKANNNLHIWELGEVLKQTGLLKSSEGLDFAILAPQEIEGLYTPYSYGAKAYNNSANIIAALNGPMAHIYLKNRTTGSWNFPRLVEDIGYVAELLRLTISTNKTPSNLKNLFPSGLFEKAVPIAAGIKRLINSVEMILVRRGNSYEIFYGIKADGSDILSAPLNYYAELGSHLYVKAIKRIEGLNHPDRSGDIVLIFRNNTYDAVDNRYTSGVSCKSWHGSLNPTDSYVPLILSYPGGNSTEINTIMQSVAVCPDKQCEGNWNVTEIVREMISRQYTPQ